jgi:hypothetical protein
VANRILGHDTPETLFIWLERNALLGIRRNDEKAIVKIVLNPHFPSKALISLS